MQNALSASERHRSRKVNRRTVRMSCLILLGLLIGFFVGLMMPRRPWRYSDRYYQYGHAAGSTLCAMEGLTIHLEVLANTPGVAPPESLQQLALLRGAADVKDWYVARDGWGQTMEVSIGERAGSNGVLHIIRSAGPDKRMYTEDDLVQAVWNMWKSPVK